ncbi:MAG: F0F1 ATP synthase subunit A [Dehalococcoidia bacterium]|nr:F0F1 ATP synthase subunit A [Dehalococcoidia bacterium]
MNAKRLPLIIGLGLFLLFLVGCVGGAIGSSMFRDAEGVLPVPGVHMPPQQILGEERGEVVSGGGFQLTNTILSSLIASGLLILLFWLGTSRIKVVPGRLQSLLEAIVEGLLGFMESIIGAGRARRFFPLIGTIFLFVLFNAWISLLPIYQALGITRWDTVTLSEIDAHYEEFVVDNEDTPQLRRRAEIDNLHEIIAARYEPAFEAEELATGKTADEAHVEAQEKAHKKAEQVKVRVVNDGHVLAHPIILEGHKLEGGIEEAVELAGGEVDKRGAGLSATLLRPAGTDINMPLALALVSFVMVEALGLWTFRLGYLAQFFPVKRIIRGDVMALFLGFLEFAGHLVRLLSFTFRLFGNMMAGEILLLLSAFMVTFLFTIPFYGLELLVGFIQALIFAGLTVVFAASALTPHEGGEGHDHH